MEVSLPRCCLGFKDLIQHHSDNQLKVRSLRSIMFMELISSLHFQLSIEATIDFVFTCFISEQGEEYDCSSFSMS